MNDIECEIAFANSAYLSELWAIRDLTRIKTLCLSQWKAENEEQLQDEVRHARSLLDFLKSTGQPMVADLKFSMQERLYAQYVDLGKSTSLAEVCAVHDVTEWRAAWIYRTFIKHGQSTELKNISRAILEDEKRHAQVTGLGMQQSAALLTSALQGIDRRLFRREIPERFGRQLIHNSDFWTFYFAGAEKVSA